MGSRTAVRAFVLLALVCLLGGGSAILAQSPLPLAGNGGDASTTETAPPADRQTPAAAPQPYRLPFLARSMEETALALRGVEKRLRSEAIAKEIERTLEETRNTLESLEALLADTQLSGQSIRSLTDRRQSWIRLQSRIESSEKSLERRATQLEDDRAKLDELEARWLATRESMKQRRLPKVVRERVDAVLARLAATDEPAEDAFAAVLLLQERAAGQRIRVAAAIENLDAAIVSAQERVFAQRGRPLWRIFGIARESPGLIEDVSQTVREKIEIIRDYFDDARSNLVALGLIVVALLALAFGVRRRSSSFERGSLARVLVEKRSLSSAILVALVLWIYGQFDAPRPIVELMILALVVPLYRVLSLWLRPALRPALLGLVGLVLLDRLRGFVSDDSWAGRIGVLGLSIFGVVLIVWTLRARGPWRDPRNESGWIRTFVAIARVVAASLVVSFVANVVGQAGLAELLTRGSIACLFLGAVLTAATLVIETWLGLLTAAGESLVGRAAVLEAERLRSLLSRVVRVLAATGWVFSILTVFGIGKTVIEAIKAALVRQWPIGSVSVSLANLLGFVLALLVGLTLARLLRLLLDHSILPSFDLPRGVPAAVSTTVQYIVATLAVLTAIFALGIEASRFTILASAVGIGVGFGLQNIVNNFVSGLILLYERPIQTGDTVELGTLMGTVDRIGIRSSTVRTFDGAEVIVPNATLISSDVTNWTLSDRRRRVELPVGVAYGSDPRRVIALIEEVARSHESVLADPAPVVLFQAFGESSLDFAVRVWTADYDDWIRVRSALHVAIFEALAKEGIEIPFPQRDVHMKS